MNNQYIRSYMKFDDSSTYKIVYNKNDEAIDSEKNYISISDFHIYYSADRRTSNQREINHAPLWRQRQRDQKIEIFSRADLIKNL